MDYWRELLRNTLITAGLTYSVEEEPVMMRVVPLDEVVEALLNEFFDD